MTALNHEGLGEEINATLQTVKGHGRLDKISDCWFAKPTPRLAYRTHRRSVEPSKDPLGC